MTQAAMRTKGGRKPHDAKNSQSTGRPRLTYWPWSRTGENPPSGILGGAVETSASFEARSAPPPYPASWAIVIPTPTFCGWCGRNRRALRLALPESSRCGSARELRRTSCGFAFC